MLKIIDGTKLARKIREDIKAKIKSQNLKLKLVVIQVGNNPASEIYIKMKKQVCSEAGISFELLKYDETIKEEEIKEEIKKLNNDKTVTGILVQLPLPKSFNTNEILNLISPEKDVDGLTFINQAKLINNEEGIKPCTAYGIIKLLEYKNVKIEGKHAVVVGRSSLVGKPVANMLLNCNATVSICHSKTKNLADYTRLADILIVAVGKKHLINKDMIKDNAVLIDVGITRENDILYGDIDFRSVYDKCSLITPVPGGVGPMTIAMLLSNLIDCYYLQSR